MKLIKNVKHFVSKHKLLLFLSLFLSIMLGIYIRQFFTIPRLSQDQQVRESPRICVHTLATHGSHEGVQLVSYPCDKVMDWERLQSPSIEAVRRGVRWDTIFKEEGVYDSWTTPECPHLYFEKSRIDSYGLIIMKQGGICKMFAHDYPEPILEHIVVDVKGKFQVVFEVDSNNVQLVPKIEDIVIDCPYLKTLSNKIRIQDVDSIVCVMIDGISGYSTPNIVALYKVQEPPENTAPWYIEVYEQKGEELHSVLEAQSPLTREDANIALYKDGSVCLLNEFGSCRLAGLISHSPPRVGYTSESGYKIIWKP